MENWTASGGRPLVALLGGSDTIAATGRGAACTAMVGRAACTGAGAGVLNSSGSGQKE